MLPEPPVVALSVIEALQALGEVSQWQWQDVLGVLMVQRVGIGLVYLRQWAT
jgi:hypothetical protein